MMFLLAIILNMKVKGIRKETLSIKEYLNMIRPYLIEVINDQRKWKVHSGNTVIDDKAHWEWKIQLSMRINFISSKDSDETVTMNTRSNNIEIMMGNETNEITEEPFESLMQKYQEGSEDNMRGNKFVFKSVDLLYYDPHKIGLNRGGSYINF